MQKRGQFWDTLIPWVIMAGVIVLSFFLYMALTGRLNNMADFFEGWWRVKR